MWKAESRNPIKKAKTLPSEIGEAISRAKEN